jgi:hypothetical protein
MKGALVALSFLLVFSSSAIAELTPDDLERIREVVREEIRPLESKISTLQSWLVGLTIGMFAVVGGILIASVTLLIHTSRKVDEIRDYHDEVKESEIRITESNTENIKSNNEANKMLGDVIDAFRTVEPKLH